jgi:pimeloyl-ACP methyl ester carboxylesterase
VANRSSARLGWQVMSSTSPFHEALLDTLAGMTTTRLTATIDGTETVELTIAYELLGQAGRPWVITPGGRFSKDYPDVRETAQALVDLGHRVLIWDRPNCGESDVCFVGPNESALQADVLAALVSHLDLSPAVFAGGSGGARVSLLAGSRHPEVTAGLASDPIHTRKTSEQMVRLLPDARMVEPPWGDREAVDSRPGRRFEKWPLLVPVLHDWSTETLLNWTD